MAELETTKDSTPAISGNFNYNYSKIDSISGVDIPDETKDCKSLLQLAAMAYNMSNKQTAYNKAAFEKYISVINKIIEQYDTKITRNESLLATHNSDIETLKELVGNLNLEGTTSLMQATQQLVKALFNDDNYKDGFEAGNSGGIINNHETRIGTLEADKVTYTYSAGDDGTKTHKIAVTHTDVGNNEDVAGKKTDIYTAKAVDARIGDAIKTNLLDNSTSVGSGSTTGDRYIKGQVETTGITADTKDNHASFKAKNENFLMSEEAIVQTLNSLINTLEDREVKLKEMAEDFGKFLATFQLEDAVVYNGALYCSRNIGNSNFWKAVAPGGKITFGNEITLGGSTEIATKKYTLVKYVSDNLPFEVSAYIPNSKDSMADTTPTGKLVPLGIFFGGSITWGELTATEGPWQSENVVYYVTDKRESYITNGSQTPAIFAKSKEGGDQGPQGIGIKEIKGTDNIDSGAINTYTITLMDPANNNAEIGYKPTFTVRNGYGFRYIGTLTTEHENELPALGQNYTTSITSGWDSAPEGKSVQLNDYVIITDSAGNKIKVFNGTKWQEMIKGVTSSAIIPVYIKNSTSFTQIGHLRSAADYTAAKSKLLELAGNGGNLYYTTDTFVTSDSSNWTQLAGNTLNSQATAIIINKG